MTLLQEQHLKWQNKQSDNDDASNIHETFAPPCERPGEQRRTQVDLLPESNQTNLKSEHALNITCDRASRNVTKPLNNVALFKKQLVLSSFQLFSHLPLSPSRLS